MPTTAIISSLHDAGKSFKMKEAMAFLNCSRSTIYRLMQSGKLIGHKIGTTWRFFEKDLEKVFQVVTYAPPIKQAS